MNEDVTASEHGSSPIGQEADVGKRELRYLARLAWNNWPDSADARRELDEQERKALAANDAWDRVVRAIVSATR